MTDDSQPGGPRSPPKEGLTIGLIPLRKGVILLIPLRSGPPPVTPRGGSVRRRKV